MIPAEWHAIVVLTMTVAVFAVLVCSRRISLDLLFLGGLIPLTIGGVVTPHQAFSGFANPAVLTIGALLVLAAGLRRCGVVDWLGEIVLSRAKTSAQAIWRIGVVLLVSSPFLLNSALVAMFVPMVMDWCRKRSISPSKLLIPVSYFAILGGVCTLIGTSTTLVVQAQLMQLAGEMDEIQPLDFFEVAKVGLPCALAGFLFLLSFSQRLLPDRKQLVDRLEDTQREYLIEMAVAPSCKLIGQSVENAGLRHLPGLFLIEIDRNEEIITPVSPYETLVQGDRLLFAGAVETISDLEKYPGLVPSPTLDFDFHPDHQAHRQLTEVVIAKSSPIIGQSVKDANFRKRYSAVVLAGHRDGGRLTGKVGDIVIQAGDMLLIQTANRFAEAFRHTQDFSLVRSVDEFEPRQHDKAWLAGLIVTAMVVWLLLGSLLGGGSTWANPPVAAFAAILAMVLTRCMHWSDARNSINVQMLMTIALALGMGEAMRVSGSASILAGLVQHLGSNPLLIVVAVYLLTMVMTEMVSNSAVAAIMIPISIEIASTGQMDSRPLILAVTVAASLSFITPVGYQTNLMVMGPGGYRPADFLRCGLPLSVVVSVTALVMLKLIFGL